MHELTDFFTNLTVVLGVAAVTAFVFHKLRQPVVLGYILAGLIIGPHVAIPIVADSETVHTLSELGVILLLFSLGLEFSIRNLFRVLPTAGLVALIQCTFMMWLGYVAGRAFGWTVIESVYAGAIIMISSTTIIVKAFSEMGMRDKVTEIVFAILIVEDLIAILLLAGLPAFTQQTDASGWLLARTAGTLFMFLLTLLIAGVLLVPRVVRVVMRMNRPEITLVVCIGICFAMSLLAKKMGYSVALGAFIAGSLMAEVGEEGYIDALVRPVRDMFAAIFFVSVGMLIDPSVMGNYWQSIIVFTVLVIVGKFLGVVLGAFLAGYDTRLSIRSGMSLAQIGEFSFIIAGIGIATGATRNFLYPLAVAVSAISTLSTPWMIRSSASIATWVDRHMPHRLQTFATMYTTWIQQIRKSHSPTQWARVRRLFLTLLFDATLLTCVIIAASLSMDVFVLRMGEWLTVPNMWARYIAIGMTLLLALPFCIGIVRCIRALGFVLASCVMPEQKSGELDLARAPRRVLMVTLQLAMILLVGFPLVALTQPFVPSYYGAMLLALVVTVLGVIFWRSATDFHGHVRAGAEMVVEMLLSSIEKQKDIPIIQLEQFLPGFGPVFSIRLVAGSPSIGRSLAELNVRGVTGASVIAITRGKQGVVVPTGSERLQQDDMLAITGSEEAIHASKRLLLGEVGEYL